MPLVVVSSGVHPAFIILAYTDLEGHSDRTKTLMTFSSISLFIQTLSNILTAIVRTGTLPNFGYWDYFILMFLSVAQGPVATLLGASAAAAGLVRPLWVFISISAGNLSVDMLWYTLGRAGKIDWLMKPNRMMTVPRERVEKLRSVVVDQSSSIMLIAKFTSGFVIPTMIATGLARVPWKRWLPSLFIVEIIRTGGLVLVGYYSAKTLAQVLQGYSFLTILFTFILILASGWFIHRALKLDRKLVIPGKE